MKGEFDWERLKGLRLRARVAADGVWAGAHRSRRRGLGLEFAGHRRYNPGDDLRWLDQRASLRSAHLLVKQFETETERGLRLVFDTSASMAFRSEAAPASKWELATTLGAALARLSMTGGDPVGAALVGEAQRLLRASRGRDAYERLVAALESTEPRGRLGGGRAVLDRLLGSAHQSAGRGTLFVVFSDLFELGDRAEDALAALAARGRQLCVVQVLDPAEAELSFEGPVRLRSMESSLQVETQAEAARPAYREALAALQARYRAALVARGAQLVVARTDRDPVDCLHEIATRGAQGPGSRAGFNPRESGRA